MAICLLVAPAMDGTPGATPASPSLMYDLSGCLLFTYLNSSAVSRRALGGTMGDLLYPGGVAAFCGRIVVADPGNDRLQVFSDKGHFVREVGRITGGAGGPDRLSSSDMTQQLVVSSQDESCVRVYNGAFHLVQKIAIAMRSRSPAAGNGVVGTGITVDGARMWVALSDLVESEANRGREMLAGKLALFVQAG